LNLEVGKDVSNEDDADLTNLSVLLSGSVEEGIGVMNLQLHQIFESMGSSQDLDCQ
jgi:hypothetical protein